MSDESQPNNQIVTLDRALTEHIQSMPHYVENTCYCYIAVTPRGGSAAPSCRYEIMFVNEGTNPIPIDTITFHIDGIRIVTPRKTIMHLQDCAFGWADGEITMIHPLAEFAEINATVTEPWSHQGVGTRLLVIKTNMFGDAEYASETFMGRSFVRVFPHTPDGWDDARSYAQGMAERQADAPVRVAQVYQGLFAVFAAMDGYAGFVMRPGDGPAGFYYLDPEAAQQDAASDAG